MATPMNLKKLTVDKLMKLRADVDAVLSTKVAEERRSVQDQLSKLDRLTGSGAKGRGRGPRGAVPPKYHNPDNPAETWAGRGLKPRWLTATLKGGKKLEHFAIAAQKQVRGRPRKARAKAA